jgi:hypothetical protein
MGTYRTYRTTQKLKAPIFLINSSINKIGGEDHHLISKFPTNYSNQHVGAQNNNNNTPKTHAPIVLATTLCHDHLSFIISKRKEKKKKKS